MKQPVITLCHNLKSVSNNVRVHKSIWRKKLTLSVAEDGGFLAVMHQTRDAKCDPISQCRRCQTNGNLYDNVVRIMYE